MSMSNVKIGFMGGGHMARAIAEGVLKKGILEHSQIIVSSPSEATLNSWNSLMVATTQENFEVVVKADIIFLTFKPYQLDSALENIMKKLPKSLPSKLYVSVLAGIPSDVIHEKLKTNVQSDARLIRVMLNTPIKVCEGCSALAGYTTATKSDIEMIQKLLSSVGECEVMSENLIAAVTGLIGSGPAFIYTIIDALSDGGVKQGLPRNTATKFAAQTLLGAAKMVLETKKHPSELKDEVCSAGGTTIYGIHALEKGKLRATLMDAVEAAVLRGEEIGKISQSQF